mmetsp:Transcript_10777/g.37549  ORF Transcript_10777/g.37549 Transcript_10777/m.37549 type:complete len:232 (-) Transcript_10777:108-803(-)
MASAATCWEGWWRVRASRGRSSATQPADGRSASRLWTSTTETRRRWWRRPAASAWRRSGCSAAPTPSSSRSTPTTRRRWVAPVTRSLTSGACGGTTTRPACLPSATSRASSALRRIRWRSWSRRRPPRASSAHATSKRGRWLWRRRMLTCRGRRSRGLRSISRETTAPRRCSLQSWLTCSETGGTGRHVDGRSTLRREVVPVAQVVAQCRASVACFRGTWTLSRRLRRGWR